MSRSTRVGPRMETLVASRDDAGPPHAMRFSIPARERPSNTSDVVIDVEVGDEDVVHHLPRHLHFKQKALAARSDGSTSRSLRELSVMSVRPEPVGRAARKDEGNKD